MKNKFFTIVLCLFAVIGTKAQTSAVTSTGAALPVTIKVSTGTTNNTDQFWYYFMHSARGGFALSNTNKSSSATGVNVKAFTGSADNNYQKWKVVASPSAANTYKIISANGDTLYSNGTTILTKTGALAAADSSNFRFDISTTT